MDSVALGLSALSEALRSELPGGSLVGPAASVPRSGLPLVTPLLLLVSLWSKALEKAASAAPGLSAAPTALRWGFPMCALVALLLPKRGCWPVSRSARRCSVSVSRGSGMAGKALGKAAVPSKSLGEGAASLVSPLPNVCCLVMAPLFKNSGWMWACGALSGAMCAV